MPGHFHFLTYWVSYFQIWLKSDNKRGAGSL